MTTSHNQGSPSSGDAPAQQPGEQQPLRTEERPPSPPAPVTGPSPVTTAGPSAQAPAGWWNLLRALFSGDPARVTDAALGHTPTGRTLWTWAFAAVVNGALVGLAIVLLMARLASGLGFFFAPDAGDYLAGFVLPVVGALALVLVRAGAVAGLFASQHRAIPFRDAAALAGITFAASAPFCAAMLVLSMIPGTFALVVLAVVGTFTAFYAEIMLYVAVARVGRFPRSPALPHAALSAAWLCLMGFLAGTIVTDVATDLLGALGGVL